MEFVGCMVLYFLIFRNYDYLCDLGLNGWMLVSVFDFLDVYQINLREGGSYEFLVLFWFFFNLI